ncbi:hypothetical protein ANO11243_028950 [Dothideomycetidae sp. 11243]|nr:hypothetical protein ANO11243_028950 [fungal sp. No.11243]
MAPPLIFWRRGTDARVQTQKTASIPDTLNGLLALCAQPCLVNYVNRYWLPQPCTNSSGLACLCDNYSTSGFSLGEVALQCVANACSEPIPSADVSQAQAICSAQSGAVPATHSSLSIVVSVLFTSTVEFSSTITTHSPSASTSGLLTTTREPSTLATTTSASTISGTSQSGPASSTTASPTSASLSHPTSTPAQSGGALTSGQTAAVTVGAFGGLGIAVACLFCCLFWRRKKEKNKKKKDDNKKKRHSYDFRCASSPRQPPPLPPTPPRNGLSDPFRTPPRPFPTSHHRSPSSNAHLAPNIYITQPSSRTPSPYSRDNDRTTARLLPSDRPPAPPTLTTPRPYSSSSRYTVFEEDQALSMPPIPDVTTAMPLSRPRYEPMSQVQSQKPIVVDVRPSVARRRSIQAVKNLKLKLTIPPPPDGEMQPGQTSATATGRGLKSAGALPESGKRLRFATPTSAPFPSASSGMSYLPSYYMSNDSRTPQVPPKSPARSGGFDQSSWPVPPPLKPLPKAPHPSRASRDSETSFESVDPDEVTPPEEETGKYLHDGGPSMTSPISNLKYPKIPRPSNQAVPRSSQTPGTRFSPTAERRYDSAVQRRPATRWGEIESPLQDRPLPSALRSGQRCVIGDGRDGSGQLARNFSFREVRAV